MASTATTAAKKRKPPTFQHLPVNRAKKLKRSWVEVQKIKSKWKAQKRKEGLVQRRPVVAQGQGGGEDSCQQASDDETLEDDEPASESEDGEDSSTKDGEDAEESAPEQGSDIPMQIIEKPNARESNKEKGKTVERRQPLPRAHPKASNKRRREQADDQPKLSLRELNAVAYSRSSLHTFKSKSSHHPQDGQGRGRGQGRGGRGASSSRGRGQPDMRLRMNAMLEKIKQNLA